MRFSLDGLRPTTDAPAIRKRFRRFLAANAVLIVSLPVIGFLSQILFSRDIAAFAAAPPILMLYVWCCATYGRLASCFGQSAFNSAVAAFFLYPYEMVLAFFAFKEGIGKAFVNGRGVT